MDWLLAPFEYELTTWHPLAVHLPVVLFPLGLIGAIVYAVSGRPRFRIGVLVWFAVAALAAWWAVHTGEALYDEMEGTPIVDELIGQHEEPAEWAMRIAAAVALLLGGVTGWQGWQRRGPLRRLRGGRVEPDALWLRVTTLALALTATLLVIYVGHVGGIMVWGR